MMTIRAAIIGTGNIAKAHATALKEQGEAVQTVAAADLDAARAKAFCEANQIPKPYTDAAEMLRQETPDLVTIATPPGVHSDLIVRSLEAGAWVFCEKPLVGSLAELDRVQAAEERTGRYCTTVFQWRSASSARHFKRLVAAGAFGKATVGICNTVWYRTMAYYAVPWRAQWATALGGTTMAHGIHAMDLWLWLLGDWRELVARATTLEQPIAVENVSLALVRFESGALGSVVNSALSPRQESYLRFDFQKATLELKHLYGFGNENWTVSLPEQSKDPDAAKHQEELERWKTISGERQSSHGSLMAEVLASMGRKVRPPASGLEARRILEFVSCLYKSAATGQAVLRGSLQPDDPFYLRIHGTLGD